MKFQVESAIAKAPEEAFDAMADVRNETRWNSKVSRSEIVGAEPIREGSVFETVNRGKTYRAVISKFDRPELLAFEVTGAPMDETVTFRFRPSDGGTALAAEFDMRPKGFVKVMLPLLKSVIRKDLIAQFRSFASFCEGR